jgi:hypothetical protein
VLLGGRDEGSSAAPDERDADWGRGATEPARGERAGGGRQGESGDFDDLDDEIPF